MYGKYCITSFFIVNLCSLYVIQEFYMGCWWQVIAPWGILKMQNIRGKCKEDFERKEAAIFTAEYKKYCYSCSLTKYLSAVIDMSALCRV